MTLCSVPRGAVLYTMIVRGEGFCSLQVVSRGPEGGWFWMKLILALCFGVNTELVNVFSKDLTDHSVILFVSDCG